MPLRICAFCSVGLDHLSRPIHLVARYASVCHQSSADICCVAAWVGWSGSQNGSTASGHPSLGYVFRQAGGDQLSVDSTSTVRARIEWRNRSRALISRLPSTGAFELLITERRSASEDLRGVDVRLDPGGPGLLAQQLVSLRKVVALLDQHPDGAVQHR